MIYTFADCELDTQVYTLRRAGESVHIRPKAFEVLRYLIEHRDRVISKDELCEAIWPEQFISDATLVSTMRAVRRTIGDSGSGQQLVQTVFSYGYQFIAPVVEVDVASEPPTQNLDEVAEPVLSTLPVQALAATRRQLTVLFCNLQDISSQGASLDPEDLPGVLSMLQATCEAVIQQFGGYVAAVLGDGVWAYFGYPKAHEDTPQQAIRASLALLEALEALQPQLEQEWGARVHARLGLHTGLVVVESPQPATTGAMGIPLGETPAIAGQLAALAPPRAGVMSDTTARLVAGSFVYEALGPLPLTRDSEVLAYRIQQERQHHIPPDVTASPVSTPFVGRDAELALLMARWTQVQNGWGQVVLISGESGIGKSRLIRELGDQIQQTKAASIVFRCSPQATQSPLYPVIIHIQRLLGWQSDASSAQLLEKLEQLLQSYALPLDETVPLIAALLRLPLPPARYPALQRSAQRQRQRTQESLIAWLMAEAERQPVFVVFENLHWADPSTLELMGLFLEGVQTLRVLTVLTYRPEFKLPWPIRSPLTELVLPRLDSLSITAMIAGLAQGKKLPDAVMQHVFNRTDGVPLFVEECAKMLLEGDWLKESVDHYALARPLPDHEIPVTLQDTLLARLDRLTPGAEVAHLGAVCGREFTRELLQAIAPFDEATVEHGLTQLLEAELLYQVGFHTPPRYRFKHALIQEVAYQSLLRRQRRKMHQAIAQALETRFPEIWQNQPELIAHHYTEAGQAEQAAIYWQQAGSEAIARSAHAEAIAHLTRGLEVLPGVSNASDRLQHEIAFQIALGTPLAATKGYGAPEVEHVYTQARELCRELGDPAQLFPVLSALTLFYLVRGTIRDAYELGEQLIQLAQQNQELGHLLEADYLYGITRFWSGEIALAHQHVEAMMMRYDPAQHGELVFCYGQDPRIEPVFYRVFGLWLLGHPDQARLQHQQALRQAQAVASPLNLVFALQFSAAFHQLCCEPSLAQLQAEAVMALASEQGFSLWTAIGTVWRGWARAVQGEGEEGIVEMRQGLSAFQATGAIVVLTWARALLAEAYGHTGQLEAGRQALAEARADMERRGEWFYEAELYRLDGDFLLMQDPRGHQEAEAHFLHAIDVARRQRAKAWELRAAMSLSRLWQQHGKPGEARQLLTEVYEAFTEGFDTVDLQEAKALLDSLT